MKINIGKYPDAEENRDVSVHIDAFDVWSLDHTLALIIHPALKLLRKVIHGAPEVSNEDVPKELYKPEGMDIHDTDDNHFKRWDYVLDEMIWAFEQITLDGNDDQFHTGDRDVYWQPLDADHKPIGDPYPFDEERKDGAKFYSMVEGPNDTHKFDSEGWTKHHNRIKNGTALFGKYYQALWD